MGLLDPSSFDRQQLRGALEHCTEAHALGVRLHYQLEQVVTGNDPNPQLVLPNVVARLSVVVARVACARDQLAGVITQLLALAAKGEQL